MACCLCPNRVSANSPEFWNKPLFETDNFAVIPSLGSLVSGWLLIVPKSHVICLGALSDELVQEMQLVSRKMADLVSRSYEKVCLFEHGPTAGRKSTGCSVDHAHLHLVPVEFDLATIALRFMPDGSKWLSADWNSCRDAFHQGSDYLYIEQPIGVGRIATHTEFPSQVFRKAIAHHLGIDEEYSWRDFPKLDSVAQTIRSLSNGALCASRP